MELSQIERRHHVTDIRTSVKLCQQNRILSCYFTVNRPLKISKIEKINRQTTDKNTLIFPKKPSHLVGTLF